MGSLVSDTVAQGQQVAESDMAETGFALRNRRIGDLMKPRAAITWLDADRPEAALWDMIAVSDQEAFPVCRGGLDHVLGMIGPRQIREAVVADRRLNLVERWEKPLRLPESQRLLAALDALRTARTEMALVVDEDDGVIGAVTARGLLEALAAEVSSGIRPVRAASIPRADGSWLLDGLLPITEFQALFGLDGANNRKAQTYRTVAGLTLAQFGRLPSTGDSLEWEGLRIEVVDLDGRRIDKLLVTPRKDCAEPPTGVHEVRSRG